MLIKVWGAWGSGHKEDISAKCWKRQSQLHLIFCLTSRSHRMKNVYQGPKKKKENSPIPSPHGDPYSLGEFIEGTQPRNFDGFIWLK